MVPQAHRVWFGVSDRTDPRIINFSDAPSRIVRLVLERTGRAGGVVGIGGPAGAGKSTLADLLGGLVVRTDDYLPNYDEVPEQERDEPRHADLGALVAHLVDLRAGVEVDAPVWCFKTHRRIGVRRLSPGPMVVCEGIHALHAVVRPALDVAVFVDAPAEERWARWEAMESRGERGWGVERARAYFHAVAEPTFARSNSEYRAGADLIVLNPRGRTLGTCSDG
ncbi:MAG: hypothetical protein DYG94_04290 [Leptolyngbya sp. PLA3]|nr:hypothetical protein [Leptolyngbya sp. PL-A3]